MKKDNNKSLIVAFVFGVVFIIGLLPIIESVVEWICLFIEKHKGNLTKDITIINREIEELNGVEEYNTNAIGFEIPSVSEEYYDDEEEDRLKQKVGF